MKTIKLKNSNGETIEVMLDGDRVKIRHSDSDPAAFGDFLDAELHVAGMGVMAQGVILYGKSCTLNKEEVHAIRDAIKKLQAG